MASELHNWTREAERVIEAKNLLYFRQGVGLKYDKRKLSRLEAQTVSHSKEFVSLFGKKPETLFLISALEIGYASTLKLYLKLDETRMSKIVSNEHKVNGAPVNWGSWRQFAASTDDSMARKKVFDTFLRKTSLLAPIVKARFDGIARAMSGLGTDPLSNYLSLERIKYETLANLVDNLGRVLKPQFRESLARYSREILGRDAEYFDDFYFFRARVFRKYQKAPPTRVDPISQIVRTMEGMGLDARRVKVDSANRKAKSPSAFCAFIKIPSDVRISYRKSNPLEDLTGVFHEFGHGIHASSIDPSTSFGDKHGIPMGIAEIFSTFFEILMHDENYLKFKLGVPDAVSRDLANRFRFTNLFFVTFYAANSTMKLRYWHDQLSISEASRMYADMTEKYMGIRYPGEYWLLHHVMPDSALYSPSYVLAAVRAFELKSAITSRFGERFWEDKGSGKFLLELMAPGRGIRLEKFSKLDTGPFVSSLKAAAS